MTDNPDLWAVRELPGGLALEMRAGDDPALGLWSTASERVAQGENRVRVELAHVEALADVVLARGLVMPAGRTTATGGSGLSTPNRKQGE